MSEENIWPLDDDDIPDGAAFAIYEEMYGGPPYAAGPAAEGICKQVDDTLRQQGRLVTGVDMARDGDESATVVIRLDEDGMLEIVEASNETAEQVLQRALRFLVRYTVQYGCPAMPHIAGVSCPEKPEAEDYWCEGKYNGEICWYKVALQGGKQEE